MDDLKTLIRKIERKRRRKHLARFGGVAAAGLGALVLLFMLATRPTPPAPVAAVPAPAAPSPYEHLSLVAKAAVVYDLATGKVLYERNSKAQLPLASLTKLLTIYAGATTLGQGAIVPITARSLLPEGDSGLIAGDSFSFPQIARAALVASSNDAAEAIAESAAGKRSLSASALFANITASVGLASTYAVNGTGLDENAELSGGYGSAEDVAVLAGALLQKAGDIARATIEPSVRVSSLSGRTYEFRNTNPDVGKIPGLMLSKTGFTDLAGGNLVVVFDASINHPVAVVVLGSTVDGRFSDVETLVRATLSSFASLPTP